MTGTGVELRNTIPTASGGVTQKSETCSKSMAHYFIERSLSQRINCTTHLRGPSVTNFLAVSRDLVNVFRSLLFGAIIHLRCNWTSLEPSSNVGKSVAPLALT